jgi:hypothetical protein
MFKPFHPLIWQVAIMTKFFASRTEHVIYLISNFTTTSAMYAVLYPAPLADAATMVHMTAS